MQAGIVFDEIWAWEVASLHPQYDPHCCTRALPALHVSTSRSCDGRYFVVRHFLKRKQTHGMRRQYWPLVPDEYVSRLHFYNMGFDSNTSHAAHPINIIRAIYNPGDVIILKLDVDQSELERSVIKEIEDSPVLIRMITEMYLNMKYDHTDVEEVFGLNNSRTLTDVTASFKTLRRAGLILHYWA